MSSEETFICVECGGTMCGEEMQVGVKYYGDNPWSYVAARDVCFDCKTVQPRALSRRWNAATMNEARALWVEKFKASAPKYG
jgi:hypothetical protein